MSELSEGRINATLREMRRIGTMSVSARFLVTFTVGWLLMGLAEGHAVGQENAIPPLIRRPEPGPPPGQPTTNPLNKLAATGLAENGGSIANGVYTNSIYGFSLNIPPGWAAVPPPEPAPVTQDPAKAPVPGTSQTIRMILIVTENAPFKKNYQRKSIQISVLQLSASAGPNTARDYIAFAENSAIEKGLNVQYLGSPKTVIINGKRLWKSESNETINGTVQHIEEYVATEGRTLLQFMLVSPEAEGLKSMHPSIQSLRFKAAAQKVAAKKAPTKSNTRSK